MAEEEVEGNKKGCADVDASRINLMNQGGYFETGRTRKGALRSTNVSPYE